MSPGDLFLSGFFYCLLLALVGVGCLFAAND